MTNDYVAMRADLIEKRAKLTAVIDGLTMLIGDEPVSAGTAKKPLRNERTNERTKQGAGQPAARSRPDAAPTDKQAAILAMLKKHGGSMKPGELAQALKLGSTSTLTYQLQPLVKAKQVVMTGVTLNRRVSLPGVEPKEEH